MFIPSREDMCMVTATAWNSSTRPGSVATTPKFWRRSLSSYTPLFLFSVPVGGIAPHTVVPTQRFHISEGASVFWHELDYSVLGVRYLSFTSAKKIISNSDARRIHHGGLMKSDRTGRTHSTVLGGTGYASELIGFNRVLTCR